MTDSAAYERTQLKNERFEVESVISVGDCDQTEILVSTFDSSSGPGSLSQRVDVSNVQTTHSIWVHELQPVKMPRGGRKKFGF